MSLVIGIPGSLRKRSYNASLLRAAASSAPSGLRVELATLEGFPPYDEDLEVQQGIPDAASALKRRIADADGLLLATPEYNNSLPGVLKNAIDWLTRPPRDIPWVFGNKPVGLIGASPGRGGTRLAQAAWLPVLRTLGTRPWFGKPLYIAGAGEVFDAAGELVDARARDLLAAYMVGFGKFVADGHGA